MNPTLAWLPQGTVYGSLLNFRREYALWAPRMAEPPYKAPPSAPVLYVKTANTFAAHGAAIAVPGEDGEIAVRKMKQAADGQYDLILMDIQLPEVSGIEVTKWLKDDDELKSIPVIAITAFAMKGDEERIRESGCEGYLSKPISVGKFVQTVQSYLAPR